MPNSANDTLILLVEDNPADADLIEEMLDSDPGTAFRVNRCASLAEAREACRDTAPDAVLLDLNLPDSQGIATVEAWMTSPDLHPLIVLTVYSGREFGRTAIQQGAQDYLSKQELGPELLVRTISQARARWDLEREKQLMATAFHNGQATMVTDNLGAIQRANSAFTRITGYTADEVIGENPRILASGNHDPAFYEELWRKLLEEGHWQGEIWNRHKDGHLLPVWQTITAVPGEKGEWERFVSVFHDIDEQKRLEAEMARLVATDPLTELANRRHFMEAAQSELRRSQRHGLSFSLLMVDVDHFKRVNDLYGHETGDLVLRNLSETLQSNLREEEIVGRIGGEEFAILLPEADQQAAEKVAARIRALVASTSIPAQATTIPITISLGVTSVQDRKDTVGALLARADAQLYAAKLAGRNRVCPPPATDAGQS